MEQRYGCNLLNTAKNACWPSDYHAGYHVHIIVRRGVMTFSDGKSTFASQKDDLVIWQMSNMIQNVAYSDDFEADFLVASPAFLSQFNPEMVWASKGFIFIRLNPSFHLDAESLRLMDADLALFRSRLDGEDNAFKIEVLGRVMQIFLYDLWTVYQHGLAQMDTSEGRQGENTSRVFLRFLALAQQHARREREVGFYADKLCITPKYLSQISRSVTGLPASQWIQFYAVFELVSLLNDTTKTLTEVADLMGFEAPSHFTRYTKKALGKSPSEYRKQ